MGLLQQFGRALMLPTIVLPIAALFISLSYWLAGPLDMPFLAQMFREAGNSIFMFLPAIFAVGVALALTENAGVAGMSALLGYILFVQMMNLSEVPVQFGVSGGIMIGLLAALCHHRFQSIRLPEYLQFFGGPRFVPFAMSAATVILCLFMYVIGPYMQLALEKSSEAMIGTGSFGAFLYGVGHRLLVPFGLHHILSNFAWFQAGVFERSDGLLVFGDLTRFFAGDPTAGMYMTGFFWIKMFGLPAAALAIYHEARKGHRIVLRKRIFTAAAVSLLIGVTEPVEFLFLIVAPGLFILHAVLNGVALALAVQLDIHHGFGFSAGLFDYVINFPLSTNGWMILPFGVGFAVVYYVSFRLWIRLANVKTPGREQETDLSVLSLTIPQQARAILAALGGADNLSSMEACITRLRLTVVDEKRIDQPELMHLGASGVIALGGGNIQVVFGTTAELISVEIQKIIKHGGIAKTDGQETSAPVLESATVAVIPKENWTWIAPFSGRLLELKDVPDVVFSQGLVGKGIAIDPGDAAVFEVVAPASGEVLTVSAGGHAVGIRTGQGHELLIHVGIDSVKAQGAGLTALVQQGDSVEAGQKLIRVDAAVLRPLCKSLITPVVVTSHPAGNGNAIDDVQWQQAGRMVEGSKDPIAGGTTA